MGAAAATTTTSLILLLLMFAVLAAGGRTKISRELESNNNGDGLCKQIVETQGYSCEEHRVTTKDGYILSMQRIPTGRSGATTKERPKPPVLLQHGILSDATIWLDMPCDKALGFILADNGFDVWLANVRATAYSSRHTSLSFNDSEYWEWSWDELAAYDFPATVEHVYNQTRQKLHYVGHSLGTLMAFAAFSRHKVFDMVRSAALLSPIAYMGQLPSPVSRIGAELFLGEAFYWLGIRKIAPEEDRGPPSKLLVDICKQINCSNLVDLTSLSSGPNCCMNSSRSHLNRQQPTSTKNLIHLSQMIRNGNIAMYDYDTEEDNHKHYGQATPPEYDMTMIPTHIPLFLSYGGNDYQSDVNDVHTLIKTLSGHDPDKLVVQYVESYAHLDFVYGENAKQVVYDPVMAFFGSN
ncbi:triacylglycerol lipase 2-like isoform X1 [Salvia miltiorrhiza]|uniref:triacylglycerol lipase 2-like isoform X1 n=1 Tax=Salvia miltiorrhiza TaxID=226208 RepID=UPI0025AD6DF1|nr:triacylglycerol lipase 2-like isoform X1 [Salvia miltiorrhiza]